MQLGSVQLLAPSISKFGPLGVKEFDVFDLPFLMSDDARARQMMASPMMAELNKKLEDKGVDAARLLGQRRPRLYGQQAADHAGRFPRHEDAHPGLAKCSTRWRASSAPFRRSSRFGELYQALQTGVVDGEDNVPSNIWTQKFYEVQKHLTVSHHGRLTYALITNKKFWDSLPADVRPGLDRAVKESTEFFNETAAKDNADALEQIKASGKIEFHVLTEAKRRPGSPS